MLWGEVRVLWGDRDRWDVATLPVRLRRLGIAGMGLGLRGLRIASLALGRLRIAGLALGLRGLRVAGLGLQLRLKRRCMASKTLRKTLGLLLLLRVQRR